MPDVARLVIALAVAIGSLNGCDSFERFRGPRTDFSGDSALAYAATQVGFGPRVPGSEGHRRAGDWIVAQMRSRADTVLVQQWTHVTQDGDTLPMRNIFARFNPGQAQRILYLAHWDTRPVADSDANLGARLRPIAGANDGASGVALLIAIADQLQRQPPAVGVDLLFVDGEDYGAFEAWDDTTRNKDVLIGSQYFARNLPAGYAPIFGVLFDMIGDSGLQLYPEGHSVNAAPEVVARVWGTARELGYDEHFINEPKGGITDDHLPLIRAGLRVINVIDIDYCSDGGTGCFGDAGRNLHHTSGDTMERLSARSFQVVGDVALRLIRDQ